MLALSAIGTGTYAAFLDTEKGPGGTTASGTLDLTIGSTGTAQLFSATNIAPGYTQEWADPEERRLPARHADQHAQGQRRGRDLHRTGGGGRGRGGGRLQQDRRPAEPDDGHRDQGHGLDRHDDRGLSFAQLVTTGLPAAGVVSPGTTVDYTLHFVFPDLTGTETTKHRVTASLNSDFLLTQS